jgi:hypothetical protein
MVPALDLPLYLVTHVLTLPRPHFPDLVSGAILPTRLLPTAAKSR